MLFWLTLFSAFELIMVKFFIKSIHRFEARNQFQKAYKKQKVYMPSVGQVVEIHSQVQNRFPKYQYTLKEMWNTHNLTSFYMSFLLFQNYTPGVVLHTETIFVCSKIKRNPLKVKYCAVFLICYPIPTCHCKVSEGHDGNVPELKMMSRSSSGQIIKIIALTSFVWLVLNFALFYSTGFMSSNYHTASEMKMPVEEVRKPRLVVYVDDDGEDDDFINLDDPVDDNEKVPKNQKSMLDLLKRKKENRIDAHLEELKAEKWVGGAQPNNNSAIEHNLVWDGELKRRDQINVNSVFYEKVSWHFRN